MGMNKAQVEAAEPIEADDRPDVDSPYAALVKRVELIDRRVTTILLAVVATVLYFAKGLFIPVALAMLTWLALNPAVRWLAKRRIHESISAAVLVTGLAITGLFAVYVASGPVARYVNDLGGVSQELKTKLRDIGRPMEKTIEAGKQLENVTETIAGSEANKVVLKGPGLMFTVAENVQYLLTNVAATLVLLFFMLASGSHFHSRLIELYEGFSEKKQALSVLLAVESDVSRYLVSISIINIILGLTLAAAFWSIGLPDPLSWGITATILNFIPYIGALIGIALVAAVSVLEFDQINWMLLPPGLYLLATMIEGQFITPSVLGKRFNLNPVVILGAVAVWGWLWGIVGALVSVPFLVVLKVVCAHTGFAPVFYHFVSSGLKDGNEPAEPKTGPASP